MATDCMSDSDDGRTGMWIQYLLDLDIPGGLPPYQRLMLAILRQAVVDYFGDDPQEQLDAAIYFARSPIYRETLHLFHLPDNVLPQGVDLSAYRKEERLNDDYELDPLRLETLVRQLTGAQLKIVLSMGMLALPAATRKISLKCGLSRSTVLGALDQLATQGLVVREEQDGRAAWGFPAAVQKVIDEVLGA